MRASHINELQFGQTGRSVSGGFGAMILDKGIATLPHPDTMVFPKDHNDARVLTQICDPRMKCEAPRCHTWKQILIAWVTNLH